jgi:hypothetical protein
MDRRKKFDAPAPVVVATTPVAEDEGGAVVYIGEHSGSVRNIDLTKWLNRGIDEWVWACASQLRAFLNGKSVRTRTIACYGSEGIPAFFQFLTSAVSPIRPEELDRRRMEQFVVWINEHSQWKMTTKCNRYSSIKSFLVGLMARGVVPGDRSIFPPNPFPNSAGNTQGETPLSPTERIRLAGALRDDLVSIYKGSFGGHESIALTVHALMIEFRTGLNTTPLLELRRDCLKPHPFMPNMMVLSAFKHRSNSTHIKSLRNTRSDALPTSIPMDGVALFNKVIERTQTLADSAPKNLRDCVWLFVAEGFSPYRGKLRKMTAQTFVLNTQAIVDRHDLRADNGERLRVNASRLRKTMENRLWLLSNGDLFTVAGIMGHTPQVADTHYLACTDEMRKNATFVGEALPDIYRGNGAMEETGEHKAILLSKLENTPVGSCKDSINGDKAPKDGSRCSDFFSCFSCRSYAIVGSPKDLHRLFSFYWFMEVERQRTRSREWGEQFMVTMNLIDSFMLDKFDSALVAEAKEKARVEPLKFWKNYQLNGEGMADHDAT